MERAYLDFQRLFTLALAGGPFSFWLLPSPEKSCSLFLFYVLPACMKLFLPIQIIIAACVMLGGCAASQLDLSLKGIPLPQAAQQRYPLQAVVGVDSFVDLRPQLHGDDNKKWLGFIPGILWIDIDSDIPELYTSCAPYNSRPFNQTVAEGVTDALTRSGLVQTVAYMPADPYRAVDYRLEGVLRRSLVKETSYYYGSCMYVWLFRVLSFPYMSYNIQLEFDLRLRCVKDNQLVWQGRVEGSAEDRYQTVYSLARGRDGKHIIAYNFSRILSEKLPAVFAAMHDGLARDLQKKNQLAD